MWALCTDRSPDWRPAGTKCLLASPGGVAERSESFKMMIAGGNHTVIKKLLSVARLMRGGDRLVNECSWMSGICFSFYHSTYCCGDFKRSPPLISLFCQSVPKCRLPKNPASPWGVAERSESFKIMIAGGNHSMIKKPRSASPLAVRELLVRTVYYGALANGDTAAYQQTAPRLCTAARYTLEMIDD